MMELPELPRWLQLGAKGRDVLALQRALRRAGFLSRDYPIGKVFDEVVDAAVRAFQTAQGLEIDGVVGPDTYAALGPYYDSRGRWLLTQVRPVPPDPGLPLPNGATMRQKILLAAHAGVERRSEISYTQDARRMDGIKRRIVPPSVPRWEDCSSFATWCYWVSGAPDPNGRNYDGFGYTGTQIMNGVETTDPRPGDLCFYGPSRSNITHVTVYVGNGRVVSHGREDGPELYGAINYRRSQDLRQTRTYLP
jgi:Putative peptidoglycan binding domain/NlpC/P60 family